MAYVHMAVGCSCASWLPAHAESCHRQYSVSDGRRRDLVHENMLRRWEGLLLTITVCVMQRHRLSTVNPSQKSKQQHGVYSAESRHMSHNSRLGACHRSSQWHCGQTMASYAAGAAPKT